MNTSAVETLYPVETLYTRKTPAQKRRARIVNLAACVGIAGSVTALGYFCPPAFALFCVAGLILL